MMYNFDHKYYLYDYELTNVHARFLFTIFSIDRIGLPGADDMVD